MDGYWKSMLADVTVKVRLGIHPHEKIAPQPILVNVELYSPMQRSYGATLAELIDYDPIRAHIVGWQALPQVELIETLLLDLLDHCFTNPLVERVCARIVKPAVFADTRAAGVEVMMSRREWSTLHG